MKVSELKPGTPIEFNIVSTNSDVEMFVDEDRTAYISSVFDITKNDQILFHLPSRHGRMVTIPMEVPFSAIFNTGKEVFQADGMVVKRGHIENFPVYLFVPDSSELKKVQRREYYRFPCLLSMKMICIPRDVALLPSMPRVEAALNKYQKDFGQPVNGTILDISGGGARFTSKRDFVEGTDFTYMSFAIELSRGRKYISVVARRVHSEYKREAGLFEHRVEFLFKEPEDRETIIKYIFDEDRKLRKKVQGL